MASSDRVKTALIGHPLDALMFRTLIQKLRPDKTWRDELLLKIFEWSHSFKLREIPDISFDGVTTVDGSVFMVPFIPEMKEIALQKVVDKVIESLELAHADGCSVAAMGAFTSIVLQGKEEALEQQYGLRITSGNTLTAAAIIESVEELTRRFNINISETTVAIIGASGDIGTACACWFGGRAKKLLLTARGLHPLKQMVEKYGKYISCPYELSSDNSAAAKQARIVIFVTSAYGAIVGLEEFSPGTIVCDASAPPNVRVGDVLRPDVFVYHGGILSLPVDMSVGFDLGLASPRHFFGCQVEGLLIAMNPHLPSSWGRGQITPEKVAQYLEVIKQYPKLGLPFTIGDKIYSDLELDAYSDVVSKAFPRE